MIMNGRVILVKLGINHIDKLKISKNSILRLLINEKILDICINHAIDTKMKKTSVQDLTI